MRRKLQVQVEWPAARDGAETWQLVVPYGRWDHPVYGAVDNSPERVRRYLDNWQREAKRQGDGGVLPFTLDHDDSRGASGWLRRQAT